MKKYHLTIKSFIPARIDEVWDMAASPKQLVALTPKLYGLFLKENSKIYEGGTIHMGLGIEGFLYQYDWIARIEKVRDHGSSRCFVDVQESGPFSYWRHEHIFEERGGGVMVEDKITYSLPMGFIKSAHPVLNLWVKPSLTFLFRERQRRMRKILDRRKLGWKESYSNV